MLKRLGFLICAVLLALFVVPAHAQKPIFLVPGGSSGPPTGNTVALGTGLSFASIPAVFIPANALLQYNTPWTMSFGIVAQPTPLQATYMSNGAAGIFDNSANNTLLYGVSSGSGLNCPSFGSLIATTCVSQYLISDGNPHLLVMMNDGTNLRLCVDGGLVDIKPAGTYVPPNGNGQIGQGNIPFTLVDVRQWSRALSVSECATLSALFHIGLVPTTGNSLQTGIVSEWPLGAGTITLPSGVTSGSVTDIINGINGIIDTTPPTVAVTAPTNGATGLSGNVTVTATATDNTKVTQVQFLVDGKLLTTLTSGPYTTSWNSATLVDGSHTFQAIATDFAGNTTTSATVTASTSNGIAANAVLHFATAGNNANGPACLLATPCQTIAYLNTLTLYPTWSVVFNGGDGFAGCILLGASNVPSGGYPTHPIVIGAYGAGKPTINSNCPGSNNGPFGPKSSALEIQVDGITVQDTIISANGTITQFGIKLASGVINSTALDTIVIQRNTISGFYTNAVQDAGSEIFVQGFTSVCAAVQNVSILNNTVGDPSSPTSLDQGGFSTTACGSPDMPNNFTWQGNVYQNIGGASVYFGQAGNGNVPNHIQNGTVQFDISHDNGANSGSLCGGAGGIWVNNSVNITVKFSEAFNQQYIPQSPPPANQCDNNAMGIDGFSNSGITFEYDYVHHSSGPGLYACANCSGWGPLPVTYRYSVHENNASAGNLSAGGEIALEGNGGIFNVYNITVYNANNNTGVNRASSCITSFQNNYSSGVAANILCEMAGTDVNGLTWFYADNHGGNAGLVVINNGFFNAGGGNPTWTWQGNQFHTFAAWVTASSGGLSGAGTITTNPGLTSVGGNVGCLSTTVGNSSWPNPCPSGYKLSSTSSPYIGVGLDLTASPYLLNVGTVDAFNQTIPLTGHGTNYNIGADGGFP